MAEPLYVFQKKGFSSPLVSKVVIIYGIAIVLGTSKITLADIFLPHQLSFVVYEIHFSGCKLQFTRV